MTDFSSIRMVVARKTERHLLSLKLSLNLINTFKITVFVIPARQHESQNYVIANKE
jgi:hypothetical protein